jgi:hypothetical protein
VWAPIIEIGFPGYSSFMDVSLSFPQREEAVWMLIAKGIYLPFLANGKSHEG